MQHIKLIILLTITTLSYCANGKQKVIAKPLVIPPGMVSIQEIPGTLKLDIHYTGSNNFTGKPLPGYKAPFCFLRKKTAAAILKVAALAKKEGLLLVLYDCYRPFRANVAMVDWARDSGNMHLTGVYIPSRNFKSINPANIKVSHMCGNTIDLGLIKASFYKNHNASEVPDSEATKKLFGTDYDDLSTAAWTKPAAKENITREQVAMRSRLKSLMAKGGFRNYYREWWHYTKPNDPGRGYDIQIEASK